MTPANGCSIAHLSHSPDQMVRFCSVVGLPGVRDKVREAYAASSWPSEVLQKAGYQRWNAPIRSSLSTRVRT